MAGTRRWAAVVSFLVVATLAVGCAPTRSAPGSPGRAQLTRLLAAVRVVESAKGPRGDAGMPAAPVVVAPATVERLSVARFVVPPAPRRSRAFSMVFLI